MTASIPTELDASLIPPFNPYVVPAPIADKLRAAHRAAVRVGDIAAAHGSCEVKFSRWTELLDRRDDMIADLISSGGFTREAVRAVLPSAM